MNERLCTLYEEDCRTAVFGKTERTVGWEGDGRFCDWVPTMESDRFTSHPFTLDGVLHCRNKIEAFQMREHLDARLRNCGLELHPEKTRVVYCKDSNRSGAAENVQFDFLGYTFRPRKAMSRSGCVFTSFAPAISRSAASSIRQTVRGWRLSLRSSYSLEELARVYSTVIRGWMGYYCRFYPSAFEVCANHLDEALVRWAMRKYKRFRRHRKRARTWLAAKRRSNPGLFPHWHLIESNLVGAMGAR